MPWDETEEEMVTGKRKPRGPLRIGPTYIPTLDPDPGRTLRFLKRYGVGPTEAAAFGLSEEDLEVERSRRMKNGTWDDGRGLRGSIGFEAGK